MSPNPAQQSPPPAGAVRPSLVRAHDEGPARVVALDPATRIQPWYAHVGFSPDGGWTALAPARTGRGRALAVQLGNELTSFVAEIGSVEATDGMRRFLARAGEV